MRWNHRGIIHNYKEYIQKLYLKLILIYTVKKADLEKKILNPVWGYENRTKGSQVFKQEKRKLLFLEFEDHFKQVIV